MIVLNWLSGALAGVGGSDFIGYEGCMPGTMGIEEGEIAADAAFLAGREKLSKAPNGNGIGATGSKNHCAY